MFGIKPLHLKIDESDFRELVRGHTISVRTVEGKKVNVILADMGWDRLMMAIQDAMRQHIKKRENKND